MLLTWAAAAARIAAEEAPAAHYLRLLRAAPERMPKRAGGCAASELCR